MNRSRKLPKRNAVLRSAGALIATLACAPGFAIAKDAALAKAVDASTRTPAFVARDRYRHPEEVLEFFGIKPNQTVVEILPGGGYWTEILGPYLKNEGTYYTAIPPRSDGERAAQSAAQWEKQLADKASSYGTVKVTELGRDHYDIAPPGSADLVVTFRNVHNFVSQGFADDAMQAFFKALKPGGILGVEDHRARTDQPQDPKAANGYLREDYMIALAEKAGFKLLGRSELLANPKDTKDWPKGVWTLPPRLAMGDQDREKYLAIGEADNFLLKFQKPTHAK
jgi:predicted methyltransferase